MEDSKEEGESDLTFKVCRRGREEIKIYGESARINQKRAVIVLILN